MKLWDSQHVRPSFPSLVVVLAMMMHPRCENRLLPSCSSSFFLLLSSPLYLPLRGCMSSGSSVTRRLRVAGIEPEDAALRAELFRTLASYGTIEEVCFEEDHAFHSGAAIIQYQRLSASERLQSDVRATRQRWTISFLPPAVHVGVHLLVTSPNGIDTACLQSLVAGADMGVTVEEKVLSVPGAISSDAAAAEREVEVESVVPAFGRAPGGASSSDRRSKDARDAFLRALSCVKSRAIGRFAALMTFATVHDANNFLSVHQVSLATTRNMYLTHVGVNEELQHALRNVLLTRRSLKSVVKGSLLRGVVLPQRSGINTRSSSSMTYCDVDAGLTRRGRPVLLHTQKNFMKAVPWDFVTVRLGSLDGVAPNFLLDAELCDVVSVAMGAAVHSSNSSDSIDRFRRLNAAPPALSNNKGNSTACSAPIAKVLASRLYRVLQERKMPSGNAGGQQQQSASMAELVHAFPQWFHTLSVVPVCVQRIDDDGLHARTVGPPHVAGTTMTPATAGVVSSREWPVFIPSFLVPHEGGVDWRDFAVPGERMTVVVLYATAIGGSEASLRLIASKRETEMRRARVASVDAAGGANGADAGDVLQVGTAFSGSRVVWLPSTPSTDGPVYVVLPSSASPRALFTVPIFMRATAVDTVTDAGQRVATMALDAGLQRLVLADVVSDACGWRHAIAVEETVYRRMEDERRVSQDRHMFEQEELVQRILAGTLACNTPHSQCAEEEGECERGRKRQRTPEAQ